MSNQNKASELFENYNRKNGALYPGGFGFMSPTSQEPWLLVSDLYAALEPFAAHADRYAIGAPETPDGFQVYVSLGECRAARQALAKFEEA